MYYGTTYYSFDELKGAIERYIKYYNEKRIKEKLGWMSPVEYRLNGRRGKSCVNSIKTSLLGENYGRNNFYQGGFST